MTILCGQAGSTAETALYISHRQVSSFSDVIAGHVHFTQYVISGRDIEGFQPWPDDYIRTVRYFVHQGRDESSPYLPYQ
ncbi:MAG: hypothetical protein LBR26_05620 [Prevotella sp.]|nr:hypothetical protein [Prevotella sp.]